MPLPWRGERERPYHWVRQCQEMMSVVPPAGGQSVERNGLLQNEVHTPLYQYPPLI